MVEKSLNLKNGEAYRLAHRVAKITGESMTEAVTTSLRERLVRLDQNARKVSLADELMAIGADCASRLGRRARQIDHGEFLYDEKGLPR